MTCIAAMVSPGLKASLIVSDTAATDSVSGDQSTYIHPKCFETNGVMFGVAHSFRVLQVLQYHINIKAISTTEDPFKYVVTEIASKLFDLFDKHHCLEKDDGEVVCPPILVVVKHRLFTISDDFSVLESTERYEAIGSGQDYAKSSIYTSLLSKSIVTKQDMLDTLLTALWAANNFNSAVQPPFHILWRGQNVKTFPATV